MQKNKWIPLLQYQFLSQNTESHSSSSRQAPLHTRFNFNTEEVKRSHVHTRTQRLRLPRLWLHVQLRFRQRPEALRPCGPLRLASTCSTESAYNCKYSHNHLSTLMFKLRGTLSYTHTHTKHLIQGRFQNPSSSKIRRTVLSFRGGK